MEGWGEREGEGEREGKRGAGWGGGGLCPVFAAGCVLGPWGGAGEPDGAGCGWHCPSEQACESVGERDWDEDNSSCAAAGRLMDSPSLSQLQESQSILFP